MISQTFQILLIIIVSLNLLFTLYQVRKMELKVKYSLLWLLSGIILVILAVFPRLLLDFSHFIGISNDVNTLFFLLIFFIYIMLFSYSLIFSRNSKKIIRLTQEVAILKYKLDAHLETKSDTQKSEKNQDAK